MADITLIDNEFVTMKYLEDKKTIYHVVHQPLVGQPLRDMLSTGFNALKQYGVTKWIGDDRKNGPMSDEDYVWADANISNRVVESGWKYWALMVPVEIVAAGAMVPIIEANFERGLRMMVFVEPEEAFAWLDQFDE
jgi:hypothetical protein